jgi:hypothetical protein
MTRHVRLLNVIDERWFVEPTFTIAGWDGPWRILLRLTY